MMGKLFGELSVAAVPYSLPARGLHSPVKIAFLSDLHGEDHAECLALVREFAPDLVIFGGDTFDERVPLAGGIAALRAFGKEFLTFYVPGNHEIKTGRYDLVKRAAAATETCLLAGENALVTVGENRILICGVEDPLHQEKVYKQQLSAATKAASGEVCSLLVTHRPERAADYAGLPFDLVLTGHAHGGQWRFPFLKDGFLAPDVGFFPKYTGGVYDLSGTKLLVSRGLATKNTRVPRIGNPPELCLITLVPRG